MFVICTRSRKKLPLIIYLFALILFLGTVASAERIYAQKGNELPGELQEFIQINEATGNIILSLNQGVTDAVHIPLISLKSSNQLEFVIRRVKCRIDSLHTQKWSFIYTGEDKCCLDVAWTSGRERMINVGYQDGALAHNAYAFADTSATIRIKGFTVKIYGKNNDQGNATIFCKLDAENSTVGGVVSYNMPFAIWNVPHSNEGDCNIQLEFDGSIYKLEAQWPSRGAVKLILVGSGVGLLVFTAIIGVICVLFELCLHEEELRTAISYTHATSAIMKTRADTYCLTYRDNSAPAKQLRSETGSR